MKYIIHRGITSKKNSDNSYMAIKRALFDKESIGVEFDIRLTKDKKIVLSHDSVLGINYIENMNYTDIIKHKYLTTLDKILDIDTDKILLIDIKVNNNYKLLGDILLDILKNTDKNIYLMSFNKKIIKYLNKKTKYKKGIISFFYRYNKYPLTILNYKTVSNKKLKRIKNKEILFIDDGSTDNTLEKIHNNSKSNTDIKYISLSRNFGHQIALKVGFDYCSGDCAITMDGDMQHPPEVIIEMLERWVYGAEVVHTRRLPEENQSIFKRVTSKYFYKFINFCSSVDIQPGTADFRLLDAKIVQICQQLQGYLFLAWIDSMDGIQTGLY